jgi:hypothetical protein
MKRSVQVLLGNSALLCVMILSCRGYVDQPVSVCDILNDLWHYRNKDVTVEGLVMETDEGPYLWELSKDRSNCNELSKLGKQWPTAIYVEFSDESYKATQDVLKDVREKIREEFKRGRIYGYLAKVRGKLYARIWTRIYYSDQFGHSGNGFGANACYAAKLDVKNIEPLRLVPEEEIRLAYPDKK